METPGRPKSRPLSPSWLNLTARNPVIGINSIAVERLVRPGSEHQDVLRIGARRFGRTPIVISIASDCSRHVGARAQGKEPGGDTSSRLSRAATRGL